MVTIHPCWLWSFVLLFTIRIEPSRSSLSISRLSGAVDEPMAGRKLPSCSQQLEKLKLETRRHVSALNAITDGSSSPAWRNRKLLSTILPIELKSKSKSDTLFPLRPAADSLIRIPVKAGEDKKNSIVKYLSSLDHTGWVKRCLEGDKCDIIDSHNEETEKRHSEASESMSERTHVSKDSTTIYTQKSTNENSIPVGGVGEVIKLGNDTSPDQNGIVSDQNIKLNRAESNRVIDLLPSVFEPLDDFGSNSTSQSRVGDRLMFNLGESSLRNQSLTDHHSNASGILDYKPKIQVDDSPEKSNKPINDSMEPMIRTIQFGQKGSGEPNPPSLLISNYKNASSSDPSSNGFAVSEDQTSFPINSFNLPNADRLFHYNNNFLPLTIQFTPMTYYQRYPRGDRVLRKGTSKGIESTFVPSTEIQALDEQVHEIGPLDNLVANHGNDTFSRGPTGKRESKFSNPTKEAVTTNYPEVPSSHTSAVTADWRIFPIEVPVGNGSDSNLYLFVGGNWVANFKEIPPVFYIQPEPRQPFSEAMENSSGSPNPYYQPSPSTNPNCPSDKILTPLSEPNRPLPSPLPLPYSQTFYSVKERNFEQPRVPSIVDNARAANSMKVPSMVAARSGYEWYDYDTMTNDVYTRPMNGPFSGGPVAFPNALESSNIPNENRKGMFSPRTDDLNYDDSLVNFPPPKYEPPLIGTHDAPALKSEEFMEHDINTSDMFIVGTQLLAALPLVPTERHENNTNDAPYGQLVADVSSRSSPMKSSLPNKDSLFNVYNSAFKAHESVNTPTRLQSYSSSSPDMKVPSRYFSTARPNDFEFVSGQWIQRKPVNALSGQGLIYDQFGQREIRDTVAGMPRANFFHHLQQPSPQFKSKCFSESKSVDSIHGLVIPQEGQLAYSWNTASTYL